MTIHASDPFATPEQQRSPVRRLRGRLPAPVSLWTAGDGAGRAGLTVSSVLVVDGDPGRVIGVLDPESELFAAIEGTGRFAATRLDPDDQQLADRFAGLLPAPGGPFATGAWTATGYGPVPGDGPRTWAGCVLDTVRPVGFGMLVEALVERIAFGVSDAALAHFRGRYLRVPS